LVACLPGGNGNGGWSAWADRLDPARREGLVTMAQASPRQRLDIISGRAETGPEPEPIDVVLDAVVNQIRTYIECSADEQVAIALWVAYTHLIPAKGPPPHDVVPYLFITSAERQSGKSTLLDVTLPMSARGVMFSGTSPAALLRMLPDRPTFFLDEVDTIFRPSAADSTQELLRGILNSGYRVTGKYARYELRQKEYPTFGPKAMAGIGHEIPESVYDRCIRVSLARRDPSQARTVKRARLRRLEVEGKALASRLAVAVDGLELEPFEDDDFPRELSDRAADIWEPLLALAEVAGPMWAERARIAAVTISLSSVDDSLSEGQQLLRDIRTVLENEQRAADFISTRDLIGVAADQYVEATGLCAIEDGPWVVYNRTGRPITPERFWRLLRAYGIPKVSNGRARGVRPTALADAFARYLPKAVEAGPTASEADTFDTF
jgi:hypothetical protein